MTRDRLLACLTAAAIATLGGALLALPLILLLRGLFGAGRDGSWTLVSGMSYAAWAVSSAIISAIWLRRQANR